MAKAPLTDRAAALERVAVAAQNRAAARVAAARAEIAAALAERDATIAAACRCADAARLAWIDRAKFAARDLGKTWRCLVSRQSDAKAKVGRAGADR